MLESIFNFNVKHIDSVFMPHGILVAVGQLLILLLNVTIILIVGCGKRSTTTIIRNSVNKDGLIANESEVRDFESRKELLWTAVSYSDSQIQELKSQLENPKSEKLI